ncbi:M60 family metallopeptidase [Ligilactobacillus aviarius]|uniref:M60 family metallopeptidase n=1 Tax=Ligilactobacillus aviarius TaxID=1606 RepID=UPI0024BAB30D|nr:M60 family metallopeptidase [Ligilactobacillus aviarius]
MKNKFKIILIGLASLFFALTFPVKINAATTSYRPSTAEVTDTQDVYTLPPQPACESPKGAGQDRQPLGYILQPGGSITITNNSDIGFTVQLSNDNSAATINERVPAHSTVTITAPNPPLPQTNKAGKVIKADANDVDLVPFILTPRTNKTTDKISCNVTVQGPHAKLPIFSYTNDNQTTFMDEWKQSGSYALIQGKGFQIMLPTDAQSYVENMDKAPEGMDAEGQPKPVPKGQKYVCYNLMDVLHFYDDVLYPTYDKIAGLSTDAKEPYNKLVPGKYFYTSDIKFAGGANYSSARTEDGGVDDALCWLQPNWVLFHETGHGYQTRELGGKEADQHVMEVSNNILGNYMYYYILFNGDSKGADQYSWNYMSAKGVNKEQMETDVHNILVDNNWSWDQILPHNGGRGKHLGLILLQNMVEKMTYAGWTEVYQMDRQQVYEANQKKETDLNDKLMNIWNLITKAAADHGYDYTAIMDEIGKTPQLPLSQEARQKQDKAVNFLWYLMPKASYNQVYAVVQELAKADPSLIYDSNFTLVTPDETKALNLNGKLNLTIYDMPSSWAGKTINIMDGNQVYGTLTIGPDGKCSLNNVPLGTYTLAGLPDSSHTLTNYYVTVTDDSAYMNSTDVIPHSESSSTSSTTSSSKQSSTASSSLKSSSSSVKSSSLIKSSGLKSSSLKSSSVIKSSSIKSSSSVKSSSVKSSVKSSSEVSSKKSSMIKSTSKASSKSVSSEESSLMKSSSKSSSEVSSKKGSMIKSTSKASSKSVSSEESSSIKSSVKSSSEVSSKKSSMIKSSSKASSKKASSKESSSIKSSAKSSSEVSGKKSSMIKSTSKASSKSVSSEESSSIKSSAKSSSEVSSKKGSMIKSTSKASSKSVSSEESSSIKSSVKSSSEVSSKKSSMIKSSSKASSKKASSKESSSIKSSAKSSSEVSSKKSSMIKSSSKTSSMKTSSKESSVESSSKEVASSSSMKSTTAKSHRGEARPVKSSSSVESSSNINTESSSTINTVSSSSANKPSKNTETSVEVPSKASTISYVDKSTEKSVPVTVSSETNTMVESSISSAVWTGSGSSSFGSSMINKPTLVSSSMNVPATSWSKENVNSSSATTVGTTVITYSQSELPNKESNSESIISKPTANTATTQHTTVINNNNHSPKQGGVAVVGNNNSNGQSGQAAQSNKSGKGNGHGEGLPQTGEAAATAAVGLGIVLIAISGIVVLEKK